MTNLSKKCKELEAILIAHKSQPFEKSEENDMGSLLYTLADIVNGLLGEDISDEPDYEPDPMEWVSQNETYVAGAKFGN